MFNIVKSAGASMPGKRIALFAALAIGTSLSILGTASANPAIYGQPPAPGMGGQAPQQAQENEVQQILAKYGQFMKHERYGDVWKPTQVRPDWRPYEPCHWVYNKEMKSWFYDDKSEWGAIVHHYGRWTLDPQQGWLWVPGGEFGPGWVTWEVSGNQVGWAPLPPDQDAAMIQSAEFKTNQALWQVVALDSLGKGCASAPPPPPQPRAMAPLPSPAPLASGGYVTGVSGGYVGGGYVGGGYVGGYVPGKIVIVNGCWSHPKWCSWWPGKNWHWPNHHPHHPHHPGHHPGGGKHDPGCKAAWCIGHNNHNPGGHGPKGHHQGLGPKPLPLIGQKPNWNKPFPNHKFGQKPFQNRLTNQSPRLNHRFGMNTPRFNRPMQMQQRSMAPRMNFASRQSFAPRMSMGGGGGMRFGGGGMGGRRR